MSADPIFLTSYDDTPERPDVSDKKDAKRGITPNLREHIKVIGIGGGGINAVDSIIRSGIVGVEFVAMNTDVRSLEKSLATDKLILGEKLTRGLGAGAKPEIGAAAALESREEIRKHLKGCDMVYITAGMGGGTGTGALPFVAEMAKQMGILTVAVITKPFTFEGKKKMTLAMEGIRKVENVVDALIVIPNDKLLAMTERNTSLTDAFAAVNNVLRQAVQGVTDLVTCPGCINVDFADLRNVMTDAGSAVMGVGVAKGENRAKSALKQALESPLMESSIIGAKGVLFNVSGGEDVGLLEVSEAADMLQGYIDMDAKFIWGWVPDDRTDGSLEMVIVATGFNKEDCISEIPKTHKQNSTLQQPLKTAPIQEDAADETITEETILFDTTYDIWDRPAILRRPKK